MEIFAERVFDDAGQKVVCRFYPPLIQPAGEYRCRWTIDWGQGERNRSTHGIDGVQAILLAMTVAHTELTESDSYRAGSLTFLDERNLDLPAPFTFDDPSPTD